MTRTEFVEDARQRVAANARFWRIHRGYARKKLAAEIGMCHRTLEDIEHYRGPSPSIITLARLAHGLDITIDKLFQPRAMPSFFTGGKAAQRLSENREAYLAHKARYGY